MGSTKIINVSRDDSFDEIRDLFSGASAEEVIFVLPKRAKAFIKEEHFSGIAKEAQAAGKKVSLMTSNPQVVAMARAYRFDIIPDQIAKRAKSVPVAVPQAELAARLDDFHVSGDDNAASTSDETMGLDTNDDEEDEDEIAGTMHVDEGEEAEPSEDDIRNQKDAADEELPSPEDEEELDAEQTQQRDEDELAPEDVELEEEGFSADEAVAVDVIKPAPTAQFAVARSMDGMVRAPGGRDRKVEVRGEQKKPSRIPVRRGTSDDNLDELAKVWQQEQQSSSVWGDMRRKPDTRRSQLNILARLGSRWSGKRILVWAGIVVVVVILGMVVYPRRAYVSVKPLEKETDLTLTISASDTTSKVDPAFLTTPGQKFQVTRSAQQTFTASGEKDAVQKARGTLKVYNSYAASPQVLVATTRFATASGLVFRTLRTITVPGMTAKGPGVVEVEVIADQAGSQYNVPAGRFIIMAFQEKGDTARAEKIYGESTEPMHGGIQGRSRVVTESDYTTAVDAVKRQLRGEVLDEIRAQAHDLVIPDAIQITVDTVTSSAKVDDATESFTMTAEGTSVVVGFKQDDLNQLIRAYIDTKYDLVALPEKLEITVVSSEFVTAKGTQEMKVSIKGKSFEKVDTDVIKNDLLGKQETAIREYLNTAVNVEVARVRLTPFWTSRIPSDKNSVTVEISYE